MKIFGSISELVDLAFRLAGGKQVRLLSRPQSEGTGATIQAYIPDVTDGAGGTTGNSQDMVLVDAIQTLTNKTLTSPDINGGTIDNTVIGGNTPAAGSFTAISGSTLDISGLASVQSFQVDGFTTQDGLLQTDNTGVVSSAKLLDKNIDADADISFSKLEPLAHNSILIGGTSGLSPKAASVKASSDISLSYAAGEVDIQINENVVGDAELANSVSASKIVVPNVSSPAGKKPVVTNASGVLIDNPAALTDGAILSWDATNGQFSSISADVTADELNQLDGINTDETIQDQLDGKQDTITGGASTITSDNLTANRALLSDGSGKVAVSSVTNTQLEYLENTTSDIQAQLDGKANTSALGTIASQNADNVSITGGSLSGVELDVLDQAVESVAISSNSLSISKGVVNVSGTGTINTLSSSMGSGSLVFLRNASGADLVVSNGVGNILTGTGASFDLLDGAVAPFLYDGTNWNLAGGAGAGGEAAPGWQATTLSFTGITFSSYTCYTRRDGPNLELIFRGVLSAAVSSAIVMTLPNSHTFASIITATANTGDIVGTGQMLNTANGQFIAVPYAYSSTAVRFKGNGFSSDFSNVAPTSGSASGDVFRLRLSLPVADFE